MKKRPLDSLMKMRLLSPPISSNFRPSEPWRLLKAPGGGGTPLYELYRYVPPYQVGFLRRFGFWGNYGS